MYSIEHLVTSDWTEMDEPARRRARILKLRKRGKLTFTGEILANFCELAMWDRYVANPYYAPLLLAALNEQHPELKRKTATYLKSTYPDFDLDEEYKTAGSGVKTLATCCELAPVRGYSLQGLEMSFVRFYDGGMSAHVWGSHTQHEPLYATNPIEILNRAKKRSESFCNECLCPLKEEICKSCLTPRVLANAKAQIAANFEPASLEFKLAYQMVDVMRDNGVIDSIVDTHDSPEREVLKRAVSAMAQILGLQSWRLF